MLALWVCDIDNNRNLFGNAWQAATLTILPFDI
jgi:hypothetical protein